MTLDASQRQRYQETFRLTSPQVHDLQRLFFQATIRLWYRDRGACFVDEVKNVTRFDLTHVNNSGGGWPLCFVEAIECNGQLFNLSGERIM